MARIFASILKIVLSKILFLCSEFPPGPGGIGNHGFNLIKTLQNKGFETYTVTNLENATTEDAENFAEHHNLKVKYIHRKGFVPIQLRRIIAAFSAVKSYPHVLCSGMFSLWMGALLKTFYPHKKYIAIIHGSEVTDTHSIRQKFTKWALKKIDIIIAVSNYTQKEIQPKYHTKKYIVIPNAITTADLEKYIQPHTEHWTGNPALLTVGNVTKRKGQHNIIKALPKILQEFPEAHYHIVGLPTLKENFEKLAHENGVSSHITFHGKVDVKTLYTSYQACDVFMMLSERQPDGDIEGFGIAILEANYYGLPAIGASDCGIEDAIDEGNTGHKVPYHDAEKITTALKNILDNKASYREKSKAWAAKHDWNDIAEQYITFLK